MTDRPGFPALDCHAHIATDVTATQLATLNGAHILAVTRTLAEASVVAPRTDPTLMWGIGVHPGVAAARSAYSSDLFRDLLPMFALVGEVGLDRRAGRAEQEAVFTDIMAACNDQPVLISIHSTGCTREVIETVERHSHPGVVLHWFLGTADERSRALASGAYFSVNDAMDDDLLRSLPMNRVLPETDFPAKQVRARVPGAIVPLEERLARLWARSTVDVRYQLWHNLKSITIESGAIERVSDEWADRLIAI
ncbi:MAG: TatD family hydrolase [Nocardioides sp.]|jgi:TatD DNase family protein|nr:TatD family hydrolase [Nocardioides sp.]